MHWARWKRRKGTKMVRNQDWQVLRKLAHYLIDDQELSSAIENFVTAHKKEISDPVK